jgi:hypothetical protein
MLENEVLHMKARFYCAGSAWLLAFTMATGSVQSASATEVDTSFFYDRLSPYGDWIEVNDYGWVWRPTEVDVSWRPYTRGHWVFTDDFGWLWVSDFDWGWAPFHYGRWVDNDDHGWVWVPGYEWGPAWVTWRHGGGYVGWAPLPASARWEAGMLNLGGVDLLGDDYRRAWSFVEEQAFLAPRLNEVILDRARNSTILERTAELAGLAAVGERIVNRGVSVEAVERATGMRIPHITIHQVDSPSAIRALRVDRDAVNVFSPAVRKGVSDITPPRPHELDRVYAAQQAALAERHAAEKAQLEQRHEQERKQAGVSPEELRRRHEAEIEAQQRQHEREQRTLRARQVEHRQRVERARKP